MIESPPRRGGRCSHFEQCWIATSSYHPPVTTDVTGAHCVMRGSISKVEETVGANRRHEGLKKQPATFSTTRPIASSDQTLTWKHINLWSSRIPWIPLIFVTSCTAAPSPHTWGTNKDVHVLAASAPQAVHHMHPCRKKMEKGHVRGEKNPRNVESNIDTP